MKPPEILAYLEETRGVEGWFFPIDAYLFGLIDEVQKREQITGNVFEIGVHHGKTAVFFARTLVEGESLGVCDVFENQKLNRDASGAGSREVFARHLAALGGPAGNRLCVFAKPSNLLTADDTTRTCRFFHIDGGHTAEDVESDLAAADAALLPDGVVALDDFFNPNWPGVGEGFYRFAARRPGVFVPILIGGNKVIFSRPDAAERYERNWTPPDPWRAFIASEAFTLGFKGWLGRRVLTAVRRTWVDLDPLTAARMHLRGDSLKRRLRRLLLR